MTKLRWTFKINAEPQARYQAILKENMLACVTSKLFLQITVTSVYF